jgi:far upstream element-binding protein
MLDDEILVPTGVVGFIIGRGGENITAMQAQTGVKVQIQKEHELVPGQTTRTILLQGATQESIDACKRIIEAKVQERVRSYNANQSSLQGATGLGGSGKDPKVEMALAAGHQLVEVQVPDADVGLIIGKMGATIKHIQATTGAAVQVPHAVPGEATRLLQITHPSREGAEQAKRMVQELLDSKIHHQQNEAPSQTSVEVNIPDRDVGLCIGRQGCVIRHMQSVTNTRIQIPSQPMPGHTYRVATVTGTPEGCAEAKAMMERISHEQSSAGVLSGAPPSNGYGSQSAYYGQQQQQQQSHDANGVYSAEWAAYHAAQAAVAAAAAAQQPTVQSAPAAAVYSTPAAAPTTTTSATASQPAADAYYEQYFRYAYYYGDDAARQYYGAWSPPPGTPNPYGVNPNGITAAPAAAPVAASTSTTPAPTPASTVPDATDSAVRDTGRRKVSNLPAWMTNQN